MATEGKIVLQPITEQTNPLSSNIDILSPTDIVSCLEQCDAEIFEGWQGYPGMFDSRIQRNLSALVNLTVRMLQNPSESAIIFSGCGTSGRLGFLTARTFNGLLRDQGVTACYTGIMAGGDEALFTSQEAVEDDPVIGASLLEKAAVGKSRVLFVGITCGLSAPFVAGQLDFCLRHLDRFTPVLLGFNPASLARDMTIANWNKTFLDVVKDLEAAEVRGQGFLLNPVVGPEPITGSSRMKSGTATKLLLEAIFLPAHAASFHNTSLSITEYLRSYRMVWETVYQQKADIAALIQVAGDSLKKGGHVYYLGVDIGALAIVGLIDASECPPTYGSSLDDVRGFLEGGYATLGNSNGDLSHLGKHFQISTDDFMHHIVPTLSGNDLVIVICKERLCTVDSRILRSPCRTACILVSTDQTPAEPSDSSSISATVRLDLSTLSQSPMVSQASIWQLVAPLYAELAVKWTLNAVSTGAHVLKGKVFNNIMIDLKPSNVKLFHRAVGIIQRYSKLSTEQCQDYLLRALYTIDNVTDRIRGAPLSDHIKVGATKPKVVPTALLTALLKTSVADAERILLHQPVVRQAVLDSLSQH